MRTNPNRFWIVVIFLGWTFDFLFWKKALGVNFAVFVSLCLAAGILLLRMDGLRLARSSGLLLVPITFLAAATFFRLEPLTVFLSISMVLFLMGILALTYLSGEWMRYGLLDYFIGYMRLFGSMIARPLEFSAQNRHLEMGQASQARERGRRIWPVLRGIVIALPVVAVFASLLSSADPIFANRFEAFIALFKIENLPEYIFRLVYILIFAYALAGTYLHAAQKSDEKVREQAWVLPFLGLTESAIVLGSVVMLFVAFVVIQFQYFFGGQANISIEGYTYSEYARKGFGELVTVAFFSLLLLLGLGAITRRAAQAEQRMFSLLGAGLVGLVIVMLIAAFRRLILYEAAYGFSRLRTYTHIFMIWLGLLLLAVVILDVFRRERFVGLTMVLAALGFVISLSVLNVDAFIVRQNVQREIRSASDHAYAENRADLDTQYFLDLSDDAVPNLVAAFRSESLPASVREQIGAALACKRYIRQQDARTYPWQSFHFSRLNAAAGLKQVERELDAYEVSATDSPVQVVTPGGVEFACYPTRYD